MEALARNNSYLKGKSEAFKGFRDCLAREIVGADGGLRGVVGEVLEGKRVGEIMAERGEGEMQAERQMQDEAQGEKEVPKANGVVVGDVGGH